MGFDGLSGCLLAEGLGGGCNRLLLVNLPVASLFSASVVSSGPATECWSGLLSPLGRWFYQVSSELYRKAIEKEGRAADWPSGPGTTCGRTVIAKVLHSL